MIRADPLRVECEAKGLSFGDRLLEARERRSIGA
jgi:hypothetical protein